MMHIPGVTDGGMETDHLVEMVDLFPTLVEAAGFPQLPQCPLNSSSVSLCTEGTSLLPLFQDPMSPVKDAAFSQFPRWKDQVMGYTMKTDQYRYTEWARLPDGEPNWGRLAGKELFDHDVDTGENYNRVNVASYSGIIKELSERLRRGWRVE